MKTIFFHLMSYPDLAEDFQRKNRSVWIDIDPRLFDATRGHTIYNEYMDQLEYAAAVGFDGVGVNEHHSNGYGLSPSPNLLAASLARSCPDVALVILGDSIALYNPPLRAAEELALIDCISGGRVIAGFPVGSPMDTAFAYGQNPTLLREKYYESLALVRKAWTSDEVFSFNGHYTKLRYVNCWPRPVQKPHPPIWIPGGSSIDTWEWCARERLVYLFLSYFGYKAAKATMSGYWKTMKELGHEPNPYAGGFVQFVGVAETEREALELYREPAEYFFNRSLHIHPGYSDPPGYKTVKTVRAGVEGMVQRAAREAGERIMIKGTPQKGTYSDFSKLTFEQMLAKGYVIVGDPGQVAEKLKEVAVELNVGRMVTLCHFGNMKHEVALYNTRIMAEKVLPQIRGLFDNQWEDHWWINPLPAGTRAPMGGPGIRASASRAPLPAGGLS
jgi:alkanesulfonate monooxygenase SsuD/methylene tetrahydromethanopterin reductase-like flavin-dependent oxidoreductase (luciferase family)